ncbi:polysaccharide deacetylase family protein [Exiguobacterium sp. s192]|uniref:polysaccharide deacetylase family protein n=1 Tax=Exiguobacterium sp. s192 TaxID=2751206 RepID=UPI002036AF92|nr:polysaccharide deacetylase family protein [Exiguobacterium sp. s192]
MNSKWIGLGLTGILLVSGCGQPAVKPVVKPKQTGTEQTKKRQATDEAYIEQELKRADGMAAQYDYGRAIRIVDRLKTAEAKQKRAEYVAKQAKLIPIKAGTAVPHLFFHSLIAEPKRAFDGDRKEQGYDDYMVTLGEFKRILSGLYKRNYVLVRPTDLAMWKDGQMTETALAFPKGKHPLVLSQDDVNYYEYMTGDGFATTLREHNGQITNTMTGKADGAYDLVPVVDQFVAQHPDFSYRGAKGVLGITGYNGVLGYRSSCAQYGKSAKVERARQAAKATATALKKDGWQFASHTYGHISVGKVSLATIQADTNRYNRDVMPLIGSTRQLIYPYGSDIQDWHGYSGDKYRYLTQKGFRYFYNVDASQHAWKQAGKDYYRQARINVDGIRLRQAIAGKTNVLDSFFDAKTVFDPMRPVLKK